MVHEDVSFKRFFYSDVLKYLWLKSLKKLKINKETEEKIYFYKHL